MPAFIDFTFPSSTGNNTLHARKCVPDSAPVAIVQIAHGIAEHINRYDDFMSFLASHGILAVGNDHLGHGQSAANDNELGIFSKKDGWNYAVDDMEKLRELTADEYPNLPYILFGHSMGSFLARTYIIKYPDTLKAVIISGTGNQSKALITAGYSLAQLLTAFKGADGDGTALNNIAFGTYCDRIKNPRTPFDWLSRDAEAVDKYIADAKCGFIAKNSLYRDMMGGIKFIANKANAIKMNKSLPVYFMSGDADPVGDYGVGVEKAYKLFCDVGMTDVYMKLYQGGRHEMLNETNRAEVYDDILNWIESKI